MTLILKILFLVIFSYCLGSIPFGLIVTRYIKGVDIRTVGSGNIGAKNVSKLLGAKWGILVFLLDFIKGVIAVTLTYFLLCQYIFFQRTIYGLFLILVGIISIVGHNWTVFLKFRGGKGFSTSIGVILTLSIFLPFLRIPVMAGIGAWIIALIFLRNVFIAAGLAVVTFFIVCFVNPYIYMEYKILLFFIAFILFLRHRNNLKEYIKIRNRT